MTDHAKPGSVPEVFMAFLRLGLTSFGGPVAHLGYFRAEFVGKRRWLDEAEYAGIVALCQFLPGPSSSQVGFALGLARASWGGALAAFVGFTLPSALLMAFLALGLAGIAGSAWEGALHGLKLAALAVVVQALAAMAASLTPDTPRRMLALCAMVLLALLSTAIAMPLAILLGAIAGLWLCRPAPGEIPQSGAGLARLRVAPAAAAAAGLALLVMLFLPLAAQPGALGLLSGFARAGALVFGGGHVVLPLLEGLLVAPGQMPADTFLAGYGAAQAMPGPLFSFAAYLGMALAPGPEGAALALLALVALFLPGFLVLIAVLPLWSRLRAAPGWQAALAGANAAVVGLLAAALYDPVFTASVRGLPDLVLALVALLALTSARLPSWLVVPGCGLTGMLLAA